MDFSTRRKWVQLRYAVNDKLHINEFIFSRIFILWVGFGIIGGIIASIYWIVLQKFMTLLSGITGWWVIALMTAAGLIAGLIIYILGDPGEIDLIVNNIRFKGGRLDARNNPSMMLSSLICIASGGSLGPEAPMIQITGSTGTWVAKRLRLKTEHIRSLTIAGMAAGFTALFGAPLGASLFALEILHHKHVIEYYEALMPAIVASCSSYLVFLTITHMGMGPTWNFPVHGSFAVPDMLYAILYAAIASCIAWLFIFSVKEFKKYFKKLKVPVYVKLAMGGLILGVIGYYFPITRYFGDQQIPQLLSNNFAVGFLIAIVFVKIFAVTITVTSGWRGGFIIPLFFIGTALGLILHHFLPGQPAALMMVCCMAALNSCVTRTPVSTIILLSTMTGFHQFIPIIFASLTGFFLAPKTPLINAQLGKKELALE